MIITPIVLFVTICIISIWRIQKRRKHLAKVVVKLEEARKKAQHATEMKNLFIQNMSHDVRTPLNAVMGFSQILSTPGLQLSEEEETEYCRHIHNNVKLLTIFIDDLLNVHAIEEGNYILNYSKHKINSICSAALATVEYRVVDNVSLKLTSDIDDDATMYTDSHRVQQILINLLTNSCKHTGSGSITLHSTITKKPDRPEEEQEMILFSVTDTGTGIPENEAENIFERFSKLDNLKQGYGLGLNICRLISQKLQGRVWCDSKHRGGARFYFEVPRNIKSITIISVCFLCTFMANAKNIPNTESIAGTSFSEALYSWTFVFLLDTALATIICIIILSMQFAREKKAMKEIEILTKKACSVNEFKNRFLNDISYQIRTSLNVVVGLSQILIDSKIRLTEAEKETYGHLIVESSKDIIDKLNKILDQAKNDV